jgi:hypothetical protein
MEIEETAPQQQTTKYRDGNGSRSINTCILLLVSLLWSIRALPIDIYYGDSNIK